MNLALSFLVVVVGILGPSAAFGGWLLWRTLKQGERGLSVDARLTSAFKVVSIVAAICLLLVVLLRWMQFASTSKTLVSLSMIGGYAFYLFVGLTGTLLLVLGVAVMSIQVRRRKDA